VYGLISEASFIPSIGSYGDHKMTLYGLPPSDLCKFGFKVLLWVSTFFGRWASIDCVLTTNSEYALF
jgi:hypothetical protein